MKEEEPVYSTTSLRVDTILWKEFKIACAKKGKNLTEGLEEALKKWID